VFNTAPLHPLGTSRNSDDSFGRPVLEASIDPVISGRRVGLRVLGRPRPDYKTLGGKEEPLLWLTAEECFEFVPIPPVEQLTRNPRRIRRSPPFQRCGVELTREADSVTD